MWSGISSRTFNDEITIFYLSRLVKFIKSAKLPKQCFTFYRRASHSSAKYSCIQLYLLNATKIDYVRQCTDCLSAYALEKATIMISTALWAFSGCFFVYFSHPLVRYRNNNATDCRGAGVRLGGGTDQENNYIYGRMNNVSHECWCLQFAFGRTSWAQTEV